MGSPDDDTGPRRSHADFAPSLSLYFDASVHYGRDNATPTSAAGRRHPRRRHRDTGRHLP